MPVAVVNATVPRMLGYGSARLVGDNAHVADVPTAASAVMRTSHSSDDTHSCLFEVVSVCHAQHLWVMPHSANVRAGRVQQTMWSGPVRAVTHDLLGSPSSVSRPMAHWAIRTPAPALVPLPLP